MTGRRIPQRRPQTIPLGARMTVRQRLDDQTYELYGGSRFGSPEIGFYSGALVLSPGDPIRATWREESRLWEITGIDRIIGAGSTDFVGIGFQEVAAGNSDFVEVIPVSSVFEDPIPDPAIKPNATVERIAWSHNGQWIAIVYSDQLSIYEWTGNTWGSRLDNITLVDGAGPGTRLGLSWNSNDSVLAVGHDETATGKGLSIFTWDGTTLTLGENKDIDPASGDGSGVATDWHPTDTTLVVATTSVGFMHVFSWDGASLTLEDNTGRGIDDCKWSPDGAYVLSTKRSATRVEVWPWDDGTLSFGTVITPSVNPPNLISEGAAWGSDGSSIVLANGSLNVVGYTFTSGVFGSRVLGSMDGSTPVANDVAADPSNPNRFIFAIETASTGDEYAQILDFDGSSWVVIASRSSGGSVHLDGISAGYPPSGAVNPSEQVDAPDVTYNPAVDGDWSTIPDDVAEALDELASRIPLTRSEPLALGGFSITTGNPALSTGAQWAFDAASDEEITGYFVIPQDHGADGLFRFHYLMASATSGTVEWEATVLPTVEGEDTSTAGAAASVVDTVQGTAVNQGTVGVTPTQTYAAGDVARVKLGRLGTSDSATGDALLIAVEFVYTPVGVS